MFRLTEQMLKDMQPWDVFADWYSKDNPDGINIWNTDTDIHWVAVRGTWYHDWAVYLRWEWDQYRVSDNEQSIIWFGGKCPREYIPNIIDCYDWAWELYRQ